MENNEIKIKHPIDFEEIFKLCVSKKWLYIKVCGVVFVVTVIYAFSLPRYYTTEVKLAPEESNSSGGGTLSAIMSLAKSKSGNSGNDDAIYPALYPELFKSKSFLVSLFDIKVYTKDSSKPEKLSQYVLTQKGPWWNYPINYINAMIVRLRYGKKKSNPNNTTTINPFRLTELQNIQAEAIRSIISCSVDKRTDVITLVSTTQDPVVSALVADSVMTRLQEFIIEYRTRKARVDVAYSQKLLQEARLKYDRAKNTYASYADSHDDLYQTSYTTEMDHLENEMQLAYNSYSQLDQQLQLAKAKVQERTPVFTTIESASVPLLPSGPHRVSTIFYALVFAIVGTTLWIYMRKDKYRVSKTTDSKS